MTQLTINGFEAVLPDDLEFDIKMENPYFTGSSSHSLEIELPAAENTRIFGMMNRMEATKRELSFPARLMADGRQLLVGTAVVTSFTDTSVKVQLVSGNAELNFHCRDDVYIDEVQWEVIDTFKRSLPGYEYIPVYWEKEKVSAPVLYDDGTATGNNFYPFIYLYHLLDVVFGHFGYEIGDSVIHRGWMRQILCVCAFKPSDISFDKVPEKWLIGDTWKGLPHWSVKELVGHVEKFAGVTVVIDEKTRQVNIMPMNEFFSSRYIYVEKVIDEYECSFQEEEKDNTTVGNLGFNLPGSSDDGYNRVKTEIYMASKKKTFPTYGAMKAAWEAADDRTKKGHIWQAGYHDYATKDSKLEEVNLMGDLVRDVSEKERNTSLSIVPVVLKSVDENIHSAATGAALVTANIYAPHVYQATKQAVSEVTCIQDAIEGREEMVQNNTKDIMEVCLCQKYRIDYSKVSLTLPWLYLDKEQIGTGTGGERCTGTLSLRSADTDSLGYLQKRLTRVGTSVLFKIQFLMTGVPDVRSVFLIRNKKFVARTIRLRVDARGLDPVYEGEFYMVD